MTNRNPATLALIFGLLSLLPGINLITIPLAIGFAIVGSRRAKVSNDVAHLRSAQWGASLAVGAGVLTGLITWSLVQDRPLDHDPTEALVRQYLPESELVRGADIFNHKCLPCHTQDGTPRVGPSMAGFYGSQFKGQTVDDAYLKRALSTPREASLTNPEEFPHVFTFSDNELEMLLMWIRELSTHHS